MRVGSSIDQTLIDRHAARNVQVAKSGFAFSESRSSRHALTRDMPLVPRTRSSHQRAPQGYANFGIGTLVGFAMCALVPVGVRRRLRTSNLMRAIFTRAAPTISGKSPEKFKIGTKPIPGTSLNAARYWSRHSGRRRGSPSTSLQKPAENYDDEVRSISCLGNRRPRNHRGFRHGRRKPDRHPQIRPLEIF
jgi:hypothetical protein